MVTHARVSKTEDETNPDRGSFFARSTSLFDGSEIQRAVHRIAHEIIERNQNLAEVVLVGIWTNGVDFAERLGETIEVFAGQKIPVATLDIGEFRDDHRPGLVEHPTTISTTTGRTIILCDDVIYTGRTVRAALAALQDLGRPSSVQLAVLVDRGHRELPFAPNYVGKNVPTARDEYVDVDLSSNSAADEIVLRSPARDSEGGG